MAALTYQATPQNERNTSVVASTDDAIGSATAALIVDNTASKAEVWHAVRALIRRLRRDSGQGSAPADFSTSATTTE